jgi:RNA polymerase sigma-70 factor, ECF subfamily
MTWDNQEFAAVFNDLYPGLCRFLACLMVGSGSAQDIAQETFVRLFRKGSGTMPAEEVRFWIYRVARNLALNELNKTGTRNRLIEKARTQLSTRTTNPEQEYEQAEQKQVLAVLLTLLPEQQRAALVLREQQEMSYAQIARVLNVSESKVKVDIHRARMRLRTEWNQIQEPRAAIK